MSTQEPRETESDPSIAFLERRENRQNRAQVISGGGADGGLGILSSGVIAAGVGRGGFLPDADTLDDSGSEIDDDDEDDNVCPSILFSCFPCLACLW